MSNPVSSARLPLLLGFLEQDPANAALTADVVEAALVEGHPDIAASILRQAVGKVSIGDGRLGELGLLAMRTRAFAAAEEVFAELLQHQPDQPTLRYNLAYSRAMEKAQDSALDLLDEATIHALPQAWTLKVQLLHDHGGFQEALELGREGLARFGDDPGLLAAVSVLALDCEDEELARQCALKAPEHPVSVTTLGTLTLGQDDYAGAGGLFDRALSINKNEPRAWIGRGLAALGQGDLETATHDLDRGAALFEDHIGSWVAAGWAYFIAGDLAQSRQRFETARDIDPAFAETVGSIAVIEAMSGNTQEAERQAEIALRLDRTCFSAQLARSLLESTKGNPEAAEAIMQQVLEARIGRNGRTIAQSLANLGLRSAGS